MTTTIAIDIDDTLLDTQSIFCDIHKMFYGGELKKELCIAPSGKFVDMGMVSEARTYEIITSEPYLTRLFEDKAYEWASENIMRLEEEGYNIVYMTSRDNLQKRDLMIKTKEWLKNEGLYNNNQIVFTKNKGKALQNLGGRLLIDDAPVFALQVLKYGIPAILFEQPWNKYFSKNNVINVNKWSDITPLVNDVLKSGLE